MMPSGTLPTFEITARSPLTQGVCSLGITNFSQLALHVSTMPYGRTTSDSSLAVLVENCGTCSPRLHMATLRAWAKQHDLSVDEAWSIREACIAALSNGRLQKA
jgi:hypothetical protein